MILCTDLQGNHRDLEQLITVYERAAAEPDGATLLITGDLVHGPEIAEDHWPEYLGSFFHADSMRVLLTAEQLATRHPGRVFFLLGNHEHAHIGGPVVSKFFDDEALRLERMMGPERTQRVRDWMLTWPLVAVARKARMLMSHGAPNAPLESAEQLEELRLDPVGPHGYVDDLLAQLLWARTATPARARAFLSVFDPDLRVAIYGHDVAREGYAIDCEPLLCISTSFGCHDGDKLYLDWNLSDPALSAGDVTARGLRPLYPDAKPVYRQPRSRSSIPYPSR